MYKLFQFSVEEVGFRELSGKIKNSCMKPRYSQQHSHQIIFDDKVSVIKSL